MDDNEPQPSTSLISLPPNFPNGFDRTTLSEIFLSVHNFLQNSNCPETARVLRDEINRQQLLAPRHDLLDDSMEPETFEHFAQTHQNTVDLLPIVAKLTDISQSRFPTYARPSTVRLSAFAPYSLLTAADISPKSQQLPPRAVIPSAMPYRLNNFRTRDRIQTIKFGGHIPSQMILSKNILTDFKRHTRVMGHKSPIYCVTFDQSGKYIITGADDNLIKVWDAQNCILRYTYRGHSGEICDLSVSHENTLLASGSNDKTVRIWDMQKGTPRKVFKQHTGQISTVHFPAFFQGGIRYFVSVSIDCSVIFYRWDSGTKEFFGIGERFVHKEGGTARLISSAYSKGGNFAAFAGTQKTIYIYCMDVENARLIATLKDVHSDQIDTLIWSHRGLTFVSGAHDGRVILWKFKYNTWKGQELKIPESLKAAVVKPACKKSSYKIHTAAWTLDDNFIFTTGSDGFIRVWNSRTGDLVKSLKGHDKPSYYMRAHPINPDLIFSAGYDGIAYIWDVSTLTWIKKIANTDDSSKNQSIFDAGLSPNGQMCAFVDDLGCLTINGIAVNERAKKVPKQQFFNSDYFLCRNEPDGSVTDTILNQQVHLCDPPLLERSDNIPYAEEWQRMIPGRMAMSESTSQEEPGFFNAWKTEDIMTPSTDMDEVIRTSNFEAVHHSKEYETEVQKTPPKGWNTEPISPIKKPVSTPATMRRPAVEIPISPDLPAYIELDSDSDDGTYSGSSRSPTPESGEEQAQNIFIEDENDSDYIEGLDSHDTVFRNTQRRRRRQEAEIENAVTPNANPRNEAGSSSRPRRTRRISENVASTSRANSSSRRVRHTRANPVAFEDAPRAAVVEVSISPDLPANVESHLESEERTFSGTGTSRSESPYYSVGDEEEQNLFVDDENDSDYFEGHNGFDTVFRNNRRRRQPPAAPNSNSNSGNETGSTSRPRRGRRTLENVSASRANSLNRRSNVRKTRANPVTSEEIPVVRRKQGRPRIHVTPDAASEELETSEPQPTNGITRGTRNGARNIELFPQWMKDVVPRRTPYIAQLGDRVVYFPQGHLAYIKNCNKANLSNKNKPLGERNSEEFAIVENIEYRTEPYRSAYLTLALTDRNNVRNGKRISFHHHDLKNQPDFIVLRQLYDNSIQFDYKIDDEVEIIIDEKWWTGTVTNRVYEDQGAYNNSQMNSVELKWENDPQSEIVSPWELQPKTEGRQTGTVCTKEDIELFSSYRVCMEDWPLLPGAPDVGTNADLARDHFSRKLNTAFQQLNVIEEIIAFQHPVDLSLYPDYHELVAYPIDLQTIIERITNKYYRTLIHLKKDIQMIAVNTIKFNERSSDISLNSKRLVETLFYVLETVNPEDASTYFDTLMEKPPTEITAYGKDLSLKPSNEPTTRTRKLRRTSPSNARNELNSSRNIKDVWVSECKEACDEMFASSQTKELLEGNDDGDSLDEILENFEKRKYKTPTDLLVALTELFQNCLDQHDRRSREHRQLNTLNQQLDQKFNQIIERYNRMTNERSNHKQKRSAALKASRAWKKSLSEESLPVAPRAGNRALRTRRNMNYNEEGEPARKRRRNENDDDESMY